MTLTDIFKFGMVAPAVKENYMRHREFRLMITDTYEDVCERYGLDPDDDPTLPEGVCFDYMTRMLNERDRLINDIYIVYCATRWGE